MDITDFAKVDLRVATIRSAAPHPNADRLMVLQVDLGSEQRQIIAGIRQFYAVEQLVGKQILVVANLDPIDLRGETSHGMVLAGKDGETLSLFVPERPVAAGTKAG